jgi:hypothetical protein
MRQRQRVLAGGVALAIAGVFGSGGTTASAGKPVTWVGELFVDDSAGHAVLPDDVGPYYRDYQLDPNDGDNFCVNGVLDTKGGSAFFRLDRRQGFANNDWCHAQPEASTEGWVARQYTLTIADATACDTLLSDLGTDLVTGGVPCQVTSPIPTGADGLQPHINISAAFKRNARTTPVDFDFTSMSGARYRVNTDQDAQVIVSGTDSRTIEYGGTAHLVYTGGATIGGAFALPFSMTVTKVALQ